MPRGAKKDIPRTAEAIASGEFKDRDSFYALPSEGWPNGRVFLSGKDWKARVLEVCERDKWKCQEPVGMGICGVSVAQAVLDPHHLIPRGQGGRGGDDSLQNVSLRCRKHHKTHHVQTQFGKSKTVATA